MDDTPENRQKIVLATTGNSHLHNSGHGIEVDAETPNSELLLDNDNEKTTLRAFNHKIIQSYSEEDNNITIMTEAGNSIKLDDTSQSVTMRTTNGTMIEMSDPDDRITFQNAGEEGGKKINTLLLDGKNKNITLDSMSNKVVVDGDGRKITLGSEDSELAVDGGQNKITTGSNGNELVIDGDSGVISLTAGMDIILKAGGKIVFETVGGVFVKGQTINYDDGGAYSSNGSDSETDDMAVITEADDTDDDTESEDNDEMDSGSDLPEPETGTKKRLLVMEVTGKNNAKTGETITYKVSRYTINDVDPNAKEKTRWAIGVDGGISECRKKYGEEVKITMEERWAGKEISVMACIEGFNWDVCQKTMVGNVATSVTDILLKDPKGVEKAYPGQEVKYEITTYKKNGGAVTINEKDKIRWAIRENGVQRKLDNKSGDNISIKIEEKWVGKKIVVTPYLKEPTEMEGQETSVMYIDVKVVAKFIVEEMLKNINSDTCKEIQKYNRFWGSKHQRNVIKNKRNAYNLWIEKVRALGEWDHKPYILKNFGIWACNKKRVNACKFYLDIWSNVHYGFVGKHAGFYETTLLNGAGAAQIDDNDKSLISSDTWADFLKNKKKDLWNTNILGGFDDPKDQEAIKVGFVLYDTYKEKLTADLLIEKLLEKYYDNKPISIKKCEEH